MIATRIVVAVCIGFLVSLTITVVYGDYGILAMQRIIEYRDSLNDNVSELAVRRDRLTDRAELLRSDAGQWLIRARDIGLIQEGETVVRVTGFPLRRDPVSPGRILRRPVERRQIAQPPRLTTLSVVVGLMVFLLSLVVFPSHSPSKAANDRHSSSTEDHGSRTHVAGLE